MYTEIVTRVIVMHSFYQDSLPNNIYSFTTCIAGMIVSISMHYLAAWSCPYLNHLTTIQGEDRTSASTRVNSSIPSGSCTSSFSSKEERSKKGADYLALLLTIVWLLERGGKDRPFISSSHISQMLIITFSLFLLLV